jgi:hypothetical protein
MKRKIFTTDLRRLLCALILVPACSFTLRAADITISSSASSNVTNDGGTIKPDGNGDAVLKIDELVEQLKLGNVTVAATDGGKIIIGEDITMAGTGTLTFASKLDGGGHDLSVTASRTVFNYDVDNFGDITVTGQAEIGQSIKLGGTYDAAPTVTSLTVTGLTTVRSGSSINVETFTLADVKGTASFDFIIASMPFHVSNTKPSTIGSVSDVGNFYKRGEGVLTVPSGSTLSPRSVLYVNDGVLNLDNGDITLPGKGGVNIASGAVLSGTGDLSFSGTLNVSGTISPGSGDDSDGKGDEGTLSITGNIAFLQGATVNADSGDKIEVTGNVTFDADNPAAININLLDNQSGVDLSDILTVSGSIDVTGTLKLNKDDALISKTAITLKDGATLDLSEDDAGEYAIASLVAEGAATLDFGNANTLRVRGAVSFAGDVQLDITLGPGETVDAITAGDVLAASRTTFTTGGNYTTEIVSGKILRISNLDNTATYGETLADVSLPAGWTWDDPDTTHVGDVGTHTFTASRAGIPAVSNKPITITVEPATMDFPPVPNAVGIYQHDSLKHIPLPADYEWADPDYWVETCGRHSLKVIYTHPSNNYKPAEGRIDISIPCFSSEPSIVRRVILPKVPGATTSPPAGAYFVESDSAFVFTLTPLTPSIQTLSQPPLTIETGRVPLPGNQDFTVTPNADGSYTVRIPNIVNDIRIEVSYTTANETVPTVDVRAAGRTLYVAATTAGKAHIYNVAGQLVKTLPYLAGETVTAQLSRGIYIVAAEGKAYRIIISE